MAYDYKDVETAVIKFDQVKPDVISSNGFSNKGGQQGGDGRYYDLKLQLLIAHHSATGDIDIIPMSQLDTAHQQEIVQMNADFCRSSNPNEHNDSDDLKPEGGCVVRTIAKQLFTDARAIIDFEAAALQVALEKRELSGTQAQFTRNIDFDQLDPEGREYVEKVRADFANKL